MITRALLLILAALVLTGCGFAPLHATPTGAAAFTDVVVSMGEGKDENDRAAGFLLAQNLMDRIGTADTGPYTLTIRPTVRQVGLGLTGADRASRFDSALAADWTLSDTKTGTVIERGRSTRTATFSADRDPYRLFATNDAAVQRVSRALADDLLADVALALAAAKTANP